MLPDTVCQTPSAAQDALLEWVGTFGPCSNLAELCNGALPLKMLSEISPKYGETDCEDPGGNWLLRVSILKRLIKGLESFFLDELSQAVDFSAVDVSSIGRNSDVTALQPLLVAMLVASTQCENRDALVGKIMGFPQSTQAELMVLINEFNERITAGDAVGGGEPVASAAAVSAASSGPSPEFVAALEKRDALQAEVDGMRRSLKAADLELRELREEKAAWEEQRAGLETAGNGREEEEAAARLSAVRDAQRQLDSAEEHVNELQGRLAESETVLNEERRTAEENTRRLEEQLRFQADELDVARSKAAQLSKVEVTLSKYKTRLEEAADRQRQFKEVEAQNAEYLEKLLDQESTLKTIPTLKLQLETYKDKAVDLEAQLSERSAVCKVREAELSKIRSELQSAQSEKRYVEEQLETAKDEVAQLEAEIADYDANGGGGGGGGSGLSPLRSPGSVPPALREKIARLERENKMLKEGGGGGESGDRIAELLSQLDDSARLKLRLTQAAEASASEIAELRSELEVAKASNGTGESDVVALLRTQLTEARSGKRAAETKCSQLQAEVARAERRATDHNNKEAAAAVASANSQQQAVLERMEQAAARAEQSAAQLSVLDELKGKLKEKETENNQLKLDKDKLENYVRQALSATQMKYKVAITTLQTKLTEREQEIQAMKQMREEAKASHKREERLIMSAFYEIGLDIQRRVVSGKGLGGVDNVSGNSSSGQPASSWLNRERQKRSNLRNAQR